MEGAGKSNRTDMAGMQQAPIEREDLLHRISGWLDVPLALLALVWAILTAVQLAFQLPPQVSARLGQASSAIWLIFAADFVGEFLLAPNKWRYLRGNFVAGLAVVLPFVRVVRILRLATVLHSVSLLRLVIIANRATAAAGDLFARHRFQYVLTVVAISVLLSAAGVYYFEYEVAGSPFGSFGTALWWAATLATTVNVGEEPVTTEGRIIGILLRIVGLGTMGYVTASIASYLVGQRFDEDMQPSQAETDQAEAIARLTAEVERLRVAVERSNRRAAVANRKDDESADDLAA